MRLLVVFIVIQLLAAGTKADESEYEYDSDYDPSQVKKSPGQRLVGASSQDHNEVKFLVAWNIGLGERSRRDFSSCTGSLITPIWMLSAAHCDTVVPAHKQNECISQTKSMGEYTYKHTTMKCRRIVDDSLAIETVEPKGKAFVGANNVMGDKSETFTTMIDYVVLHKNSYRPGGSYGVHGGYDITLVKFENAVPSSYGRPACLPTPSFKDTGRKVLLAGYGKYTRNACQTDEYSPYKYHYCSGTVRHGDGSSLCTEDTDPPISRRCQSFLNAVGLSDDQSWKKDEEIIVKFANGDEEYCYHKKSSQSTSRGWCYVEKDYYSIEPRAVNKERNWGFCSKDCYLSKEDGRIQESNILRQASAYALDYEICERYLAEVAANVKVHPEILCVGYYKKFNYKVYQETSPGQFSEVDKDSVKHFGQRLDNFNVTGYVTSAGTCNGDSGGPAFIQESPGKFVVVGAVSGGRGKMGKCGGINNPVHYVRVSRFAIWIVKVLGKPESSKLCWHDMFQKRMKAILG